MATTRNPRHGSMQFWHRKRAARQYPRVRCQTNLTGLSGFAGYKVGMTHITIIDNKPHTLTKGEEIFCPVTVVECPPLKTASIRFYKKTTNGLKLSSEVFSKCDKELSRKIYLPKNPKTEEKLKDIEDKLSDFNSIRINAYTQPRLTGIGRKKPELFELNIGPATKENFELAKQLLGKEIKIKDVFKEGQQIDVFAVTKGKGFQGPVKRFGVTLRSHKSEKVIRGPGNVGPWTGNRSWTVAHAGQTGYHSRLERNKWLIKISEKADEINSKGGFLHYGNVKNPYILLRGSVQGPAKRLLRLHLSQRQSKRIPPTPPTIEYISLESKQ